MRHWFSPNRRPLSFWTCNFGSHSWFPVEMSPANHYTCCWQWTRGIGFWWWVYKWPITLVIKYLWVQLEMTMILPRKWMNDGVGSRKPKWEWLWVDFWGLYFGSRCHQKSTHTEFCVPLKSQNVLFLLISIQGAKLRKLRLAALECFRISIKTVGKAFWGQIWSSCVQNRDSSSLSVC